jgi:hypothetical protein
MYDVYLNGRKDLLIIPTGARLPVGTSGKWRLKKRAVRAVSEVIREDIRRCGYHRRRLAGTQSKIEPAKTGHNPLRSS